MRLSRTASWFLLAFGVWSWFIWVSFVRNLWKNGSGLAFDAAGDPTSYFWVHLTLAVTSFLLGTAVGVLGLRSVLALRRESRTDRADGAARVDGADGAGRAGRADRAGRPDADTSA
ncbi:SCO4848 family membrane protein [Streptomyces virginiae]|uniref:SCO4848 family membrane protein n=1 Tax=Streptomyces virginiae TaxID=1961 RepID=UPI003650668A